MSSSIVQEPIEPIEKIIYEQVKNSWNKELSSDNVMELVTKIITVIQNEPKVSLIIKDSSEKKKIAINVIGLVINDSDISSHNKILLNQFVMFILPGAIDTIIKVAKNEIDIGKNKTDKTDKAVDKAVDKRTSCLCM